MKTVTGFLGNDDGELYEATVTLMTLDEIIKDIPESEYKNYCVDPAGPRSVRLDEWVRRYKFNSRVFGSDDDDEVYYFNPEHQEVIELWME